MKNIHRLTVASMLLIAACKSSKETAKTETPKPAIDCSATGLTFASVKPILEANCFSCHSNGGAGGFDFTIFADVKKAAQSGELTGTINHERGYPQMPPQAPKLDQTSINKIQCWINNGMKE